MADVPADVPAVWAQHVSKSFDGVSALRDVDLELRRGEVHALLGENGAGKTTFCNILAGIYRADSGHIEVDGTCAPVPLPRPGDRRRHRDGAPALPARRRR